MGIIANGRITDSDTTLCHVWSGDSLSMPNPNYARLAHPSQYAQILCQPDFRHKKSLVCYLNKASLDVTLCVSSQWLGYR